MSKQYIIGIDAGSQSSKVVIFDLYGQIVCEGKQPLRPMQMPEPGIVEHPDDDLWDSIVIACQKAMAKFPGNTDELIGVGLCTIRFCRCLLDENGELASPAMSWMDARVSRPYEHDNPHVKYVTTSSGYISHRFTGRFNDTAANYQGMWPIDTDTWQWSEDQTVLAYYNIPLEMLFNLKMPGEVLGYVRRDVSKLTGIPEGLPVIATANDKGVEALGSGLLSNKTALISLGTYITGMIQGTNNLRNTKNFWTNFASIPYEYLYESSGIRRGMWTVSWFKDLIGEEIANKASDEGISPEELLNKEAQEVSPGCEGLMTILDWLPPADKLYKRGMMIGFDGRHTRAHIYRSILEGIALTMKNNMDSMFREIDIQPDNLIVSGGGSYSDLMMQIISDVFGLPSTRTVVNGSASLGSAILVAVALGKYDSYEQAVRNMVKDKDTFEPSMENHALYTKFDEEVYQYVSNYTDEMLKKSHEIFN